MGGGGDACALPFFVGFPVSAVSPVLPLLTVLNLLPLNSGVALLSKVKLQSVYCCFDFCVFTKLLSFKSFFFPVCSPAFCCFLYGFTIITNMVDRHISFLC